MNSAFVTDSKKCLVDNAKSNLVCIDNIDIDIGHSCIVCSVYGDQGDISICQASFISSTAFVGS